MHDKENEFTLTVCNKNEYTTYEFADEYEAIGFADATANVDRGLVAILYDNRRRYETWGCDYSFDE